jgi:hypothetical protein
MDNQLSVTLTPQQIFALQSVGAARIEEATEATGVIGGNDADAAARRQVAIDNEELWERLYEQVESPTAPCAG